MSTSVLEGPSFCSLVQSFIAGCLVAFGKNENRFPDVCDICGHSNAAREEQASVGLGPHAVLGAKVKLWILHSPVGFWVHTLFWEPK